MSIRGWRRIALLATGWVAFPFATSIADDTGTLAVSATVPKVCKIDSVADMLFGNVSTLVDNDISADILFRCSKSSTTTVQLNGGGGPSILAREMSSGPTNKLNYQLYTDNTYSAIWGDGSNGFAVAVTGDGMGAPAQKTLPIFGRVTKDEAAVAAEGGYTDSVTVTILF